MMNTAGAGPGYLMLQGESGVIPVGASSRRSRQNSLVKSVKAYSKGQSHFYCPLVPILIHMYSYM